MYQKLLDKCEELENDKKLNQNVLNNLQTKFNNINKEKVLYK